MKSQSIEYGFSLIELMIVVSLIGILAAIAIPSYQQYTKRARFAEVIASTEPYKMAISLALQEGSLLDDLSSGLYGIPNEPKSTKHVQNIKVTKGMITATATALMDSATYILKPNNDGSIWTVAGTCLKKGYCRG